MSKKLMVANWKMHKNGKECNEFLSHFLQKYSGKREAWISPQSLFIKLVINSPLKAGLQNCSDQVQGAYTGEVSPELLKRWGAILLFWVIPREEFFLKKHLARLTSK